MNIRFQLLSWNIHAAPFSSQRPQRLLRVAGEILRRRPDVALLQEVWFPFDARQLSRQLEPAYRPVDVPRGGLLGRRGGLLAFARRDSGWTVRSTRFHRFSLAAAAWKVWQGDGIGQKGVQRIDLESGNRRLVVLNTHLQSDYRWNDYVRVRTQQLRELQQVAAHVDGTTPVLAAGDLNTRPTEAVYSNLRSFWHDLTEEERARAAAGTCLNSDGSDAGWIDYILARQSPAWSVRVSHCTRIENDRPDHPYSDHHGLLATLGIAAA